MIFNRLTIFKPFLQTIFQRQFDENTSRGRWEWGLLSVALLACIRAAAMGAGDFEVYFHAAEALWREEAIYQNPFLLRHGNSLAFSYPMFWAFLLLPLAWLPLWLANFLWLFLNVVLLSRIVDLLNYFFDFKDFTRKEKNLYYFLLLLSTLRFVLYNFDMSQVTIALVWLFLQSLRLLEKKRFILGGGLDCVGNKH